jgi:hypothetical protein
MSGQKSFAESIQRIAIGTSKDEVINVCSDEERMASDSNALHAALKSDKRTPLSFEISAHGGMQSTGTAVRKPLACGTGLKASSKSPTPVSSFLRMCCP